MIRGTKLLAGGAMVVGHDRRQGTGGRSPDLQAAAALPVLHSALVPHSFTSRFPKRQYGLRVPVQRMRQARLGRRPNVARQAALTRIASYPRPLREGLALKIPESCADDVELKHLQDCQVKCVFNPRRGDLAIEGLARKHPAHVGKPRQRSEYDENTKRRGEALRCRQARR
jgi:hypothetical protein